MNIVGANKPAFAAFGSKDARALRTLLIDAGVAIPAVHENNDIRRLDRRLCLRVVMRDRRIRSHALMDMKVRRFVSC